MASKVILAVFVLCFYGCLHDAAGQNTILWSVDDRESGNRSYLLGTFHQMGSTWVDSLTKVIEALSDAELAVFESIDPAEDLAASMNRRPSDFSYRDRLKSGDVEWLEEYTANWAVPLEKLRPMELHWKLNQLKARDVCKTSGPEDRFDHFDNYLIYIADSLGIPTVGLETDSMQADMINEKIGENTWGALRRVIHGDVRTLRLGREKRGSCAFARLYMDLKIGDYPLDESCDQTGPVIADRNRAWMEELPDLLRSHRCFVAVGLMHLFYDCGLITALREAGFVVMPVRDLRG